MQIIDKASEGFSVIEQLLGEHPDSVQAETLAGIEFDEVDIGTQRTAGDEDPIAVVELIAHWNPNMREGILDWFCARESTIQLEQPKIEHGGSLFAFNYQGEKPDLEALLDASLPALNDAMEWVDFQVEEE